MKAAKFVKFHPYCCFCGGSTPATTIDHQPARIIFPGKLRPKGLEFPACDNCNAQTSKDEALLALICRFTGSLRTNPATDYDRLSNIISSVNSGFPDLLEKLNSKKVWYPKDGLYTEGGAIDVGHDEVDLALCRIAAKLTLAIYYKEKNKPAPASTRISALWAHSQQRQAFPHIKKIIGMLPESTELAAGKWRTTDTFFLKNYWEGSSLFVAAIFHESVALFGELHEPNSPPASNNWHFSMKLVSGQGIYPA